MIVMVAGKCCNCVIRGDCGGKVSCNDGSVLYLSLSLYEDILVADIFL